MNIEVLVTAERSDSYEGKKGKVNQQLLTCCDVGKTPERLQQLLEYGLTDIEKASHAGKLEGKTIILSVRELKPFGAVLRARGQIVSVGGK